MKKLLSLMGLWGAALAGSSDARASSCGDDYELVPTNVEVTMQPERDCVIVEVTGSSQPGCDQLVIKITNRCEDVIQVPEPTREFGCAEGSPGELIAGPCPVLYVGHTIVIQELAHSEGHHKVDIRLLEQAGPIDIHIEFDAVDQAEDSCSMSPGRDKRVGVSGIGASIAFVGLALRRRRRERR